jgi:transposase InsO family protein
MKTIQRAGLIEAVEAPGRGRSKRLERYGVPRATYYRWKKRYEASGSPGLERLKTPRPRVWNRLLAWEEARIIELALAHPELSSRLLAVKMTDSGLAVSEATVYRLLKRHGLVRPRPLGEDPAAKEWRHKTERPDEIWQCDAAHFFIPGWGYYKAIPVLDDFTRKLLSLPLMPDETSESIANAVELALEKAEEEGHTKGQKLLTDNGAGFVGEKLADYLKERGMGHIFGAPYHPQTQGKVERLNRKIKERVNLVVYGSPAELQKALDEFVRVYNATPHEALKNVSPDDVYAGRQEAVLKRRAEIRRLTELRRRQENLGGNGQSV